MEFGALRRPLFLHTAEAGGIQAGSSVNSSDPAIRPLNVVFDDEEPPA
jgi:hypothetical protein